MVFFRCVCREAPQLFMYFLSQDWTFVHVNSLSAGQSGQHFLAAAQAVIGPTNQRVTAIPGLSVLLIHSPVKTWYPVVCHGFHPSGLNVRLFKFLSRGHSQWAWKCFEVEALSELNTHPLSISFRFLVCEFFFCLNGDSCSSVKGILIFSAF